MNHWLPSAFVGNIGLNIFENWGPTRNNGCYLHHVNPGSWTHFATIPDHWFKLPSKIQVRSKCARAVRVYGSWLMLDEWTFDV